MVRSATGCELAGGAKAPKSAPAIIAGTAKVFVKARKFRTQRSAMSRKPVFPPTRPATTATCAFQRHRGDPLALLSFPLTIRGQRTQHGSLSYNVRKFDRGFKAAASFLRGRCSRY